MQADELVGKRLGRYHIERVLGVGGVAVVYVALDTALHRPVALKVLFPHFALPPAVAERFRLEAVTAAGLDHPGIVPIYDVGEADGLVYIAMKLIQGETLADVLARAGRLHEADVTELIAQVADALGYAHRQGVIHRDVKPANILLAWETDDLTGKQRCRAYLSDFGVARALDAPDLTQTGLTVGTPAYMSPEQATGERALDGRSDLYSLGVVLYHCLAGHPPFAGGTLQVLHAQVYETPPPLPTDISPGMTTVVARALAKDPAGRYQSGEEMAAALREASSGGHVLATPRRTHLAVAASRSIPVRARGKRWSGRLRLRFLIGLLALMTLVIAGAVATGWLRGTVAVPTPASTPTEELAMIERRFTPPPTNTPLPTSTPSPTPTATPLPTPTATATSRPIVAPPPSPTPSPTPPTPANVCPIAPHVAFIEWLAVPAQAASVGCPTADAVVSPALFQRFERGQMIWRQDHRLIYVNYDDGSWQVFEDTWREGEPSSDPNLTPPPGMRQPERQLGKVWRTQAPVQEALGWATSEEIPFEGVFQPFEHGQLIAQPPSRVYTLLEDLRLRQLSTSERKKDSGYWPEP